jgi:hypothetical protein
VRWDNLFDDLEGQLEHELNAEEIDLRAEEERLRLGRLSIRDRLLSLARSGGRQDPRMLSVVLTAGQGITVRPSAFGKDWLAGDLIDHSGTSAQCVVPFVAIAAVVLTEDDVADSLNSPVQTLAQVVDRIGLAFVLRDLCRRRKSVDVQTATGRLSGTIDRVGRDHFDVAMHPPGTQRRRGQVEQYRLVPLAQLQLIRLA